MSPLRSPRRDRPGRRSRSTAPPAAGRGQAEDGIKPGQKRFDILFACMFALALALIVSWGSDRMAWQVGDRPDRDIDARVGYHYRDKAAQTALEQEAALAAPSVYRRDDAGLHALESNLKQILPAVKSADSPRTLAPEIRRLWDDLTDTQFGAIKQTVSGDGQVEAVTAGVAQLLGALAEGGLIDRTRYLAEVKGRHEQIMVVHAPAGGGAPRRSLYRRDRITVVDERANLQGYLEAQAAPVFGPQAGETFRKAMSRYLADRIGPNLVYDREASRQAQRDAAAGVGLIQRTVQPGQVLVKRDQRITDELFAELVREEAAWRESRPPSEPIRRLLAVVALSALLTALMGALVGRLEPRILRSKPRLSVFGILMLLVVTLAAGLQQVGWPVYLTPMALVTIALAIAYDQRLAMGSAFVLAVMVALATTGRLETAVVFLTASMVGVYGTREVRNRKRLIEVGFALGLAKAAAVVVMGLLNASPVSPVARDAAVSLASGVLTGFVLTGGMPFLERIFNITTDISLLELSDANQPLLRQLALQAPGTYNHSLVVGSLAEAAAEAVGANALLARLGALFHDVGKTNKPDYFIENRTNTANVHDGLRPTMSALVIVAHVKDGLDMAREHRVPRVVRDIIAQHHGTTLVEYFYREAHRQAGPDGEDPDKSAYRYPGPKPRSAEAAIIMLADAVESASRPMREPTPARIDHLVREITRRRMDEGQFDECALTFKDLGAIQNALAQSLTRIYHSRIRYPDQDELEQDTNEHVQRPAASP